MATRLTEGAVVQGGVVSMQSIPLQTLGIAGASCDGADTGFPLTAVDGVAIPSMPPAADRAVAAGVMDVRAVGGAVGDPAERVVAVVVRPGEVGDDGAAGPGRDDARLPMVRQVVLRTRGTGDSRCRVEVAGGAVTVVRAGPTEGARWLAVLLRGNAVPILIPPVAAEEEVAVVDLAGVVETRVDGEASVGARGADVLAVGGVRDVLGVRPILLPLLSSLTEVVLAWPSALRGEVVLARIPVPAVEAELGEVELGGLAVELRGAKTGHAAVSELGGRLRIAVVVKETTLAVEA